MTEELKGREKLLNSYFKYSDLPAPDMNSYNKLVKEGVDVHDYTMVPVIESIKDWEVKKYSVNEFVINGFVYDISTATRHIEYMKSTEEFFRLKFNSHPKLLHKLAHKSYYECIHSHNYGDIDTECSLLLTYDKWLEVCMLIDSIKPYISLMCPNYSTKQKYYKQKFKELSKEHPHITFFIVLNNYFKMKYTLRDFNKAQADLLLSLKLPNIENYSDALMIVSMVKHQILTPKK